MFKIYENNIIVTESDEIFEMIKYLYNRGVNDILDKIDFFGDTMYEDKKFKLVNTF